MRILIVNDDGMQAAQLPNLIRWARQYGDVTTFVPKVEQSGKSHGIEIHKGFSLEKVNLIEGVWVLSIFQGILASFINPSCVLTAFARCETANQSYEVRL